MDRYARKQAQLACQISLGLMAGIFSVMPQASAAPIHDASSDLNTGATVTTADKVTTVQGNQTNNVVAWKDFSVASDETVKFNGSTGDTTTRDYNYLNVVTGKNTSQIAGTIEGGKNVYIVNQHGVIIDKDATVNVGNLYVSTKAADVATTVKSAFTGNEGSAVLKAATTGTAVADVVNLGTIQADQVYIDGKNIRFLDTADVVKSDGSTVNTSDVTLAATGYAHVGHKSGNADSGYTQGGTAAIEDYTLVSTLDEIKNNASGKNMLSQNIDASGTTYTSAPIASFTGKLDGMFYEVQNLTVNTSEDNAGLFGTVSGSARIENLGVTNATITSSSGGDDATAATLVGTLSGGTLQNVYSENNSVSSKNISGGIVGRMTGGTIDTAYNTSSVTGGLFNGGIIGYMSGGKLSNAYNTGAITGGESYGIATVVNDPTISYVYNTYGGLKLADPTDPISYGRTFSSGNSSATHLSAFTSEVSSGSGKVDNVNKGWGNVISDDGTSNTTWRIYEGTSTPLLTAFFKGTQTADYSYNYFGNTEGGTTASSDGLSLAYGDSLPSVATNGGADVTTTYNGQYYRIAAPTTDADGKLITSTTSSADADTVRGYVTLGGNSSTAKDASGKNYLVNVNTTGLKNVATTSSGTVTKQSLISSGQHGYNIVGGNVTINQRTVTVSNDLTDKTLTKTYDGTKDVAASDIKSLFTGSTTSGLIDGDDTVTLTFNGTAKYASKNAGTHKVTLNGNLALTNTSGYNNYKLDSKSAASFNNAEVDGVIKQKKLTLSMNSGINLTREYNGKNNSKVAATSDSSTGATGGLIEDADSAQAVFTLDGIVENAIDDNDTTNTPHKDSVALGFDTTKGYAGDYVDATTDADGNVTYTKTGKAGTHTVEYSGLTLTDSNSGVDASNYYLVDSSGNIIYRAAVSGANDGAITNNLYVSGGKITKKNIATDSFTLPSSTTGATKAYDGDEYLDFDQTTTLSSGDIVSGDTVNFTVTKDSNGHAAWFSTTKDGQTIAAKDVGTGYGITYNVEISGDDVENYTLGGNDITLDATTKTATGSVTGKTTDGVVNSITPRIIKLGLGTTTSVIDKEYDGNNTVYVTENGAKRSTLTMADGYVAYADGTTTNTSKDDAKTGDNLYKIIDGINGENVTLNITGTYADTDGNVHVDSDGNPEAQNITYTISLNGDTNGNYAFDDSGATSTTISSSTIVGGVTQTDAVTPTGTITPRTITASIGKTLTKTYDTLADTYYLFDTNQVGGTKLTSDDITITSGELVKETDKDLIFTDDVMDAVNKSGRYGYKDASGTFHEDANVLSGDNATNATAQFTGLSSGSNNYKLSTEPVYADGSKITPYEITDIDLTTNTITKVYDAKTGLATSADNQNAATKAEDYIKSVSATHNGQQIGLTYDTVGDDDAYYIHKDGTDAGKATKNVTEANAARFLLTIKTDSPNYTVANSLKNSDGKVQLDTAAGTASITARKVLAKVKDTSEVTKEYDGFSALDHSDAKKTGDNIITLTDVDGTSAGLLTSLDNATNTSTGKFRTKDVAYNHTFDADGNDTGSYQKKDIDYYVTLDNGDETTQGNYAIYAADGYNQAAGTGTAIAYDTQSDALKGQGTITAKTLGVNFDTVTKTFTNTTSLEDGSISTTNKGEVGAVTGYTDLVTTNEKNAADDVTARADVDKSHYDTAWKGDDKTVTYVVSFTGDDVGNYRLSDTSAPLIATTAANPQTYETTTKGNTIGTKDITSERDIDVAFETVTKVYDGSQNVDYDHTDASVYYEGEQGKKTSADYVKTTDANKTGLKLGGISIAKDQYKIVNDATYDSAGTDASKATFHIEILDKNVLEGFNFKDGLLSNGNTLSKTTNGTITAKKFDFTFTPLQNHTQVYNGSSSLVSNSTQDNPSGETIDLSKAISNVTGLVNGQDASVLKITATGEFLDTTVDGTQINAKDAGTGKTISYVVKTDNSNYEFYSDGAAAKASPVTGQVSGNAISYIATSADGYGGTITPKALTVKIKTPLVKTYDGTADVLDSSLDNVEFEGLVGSEKLTPGHQTSTVEGLKGTYLASDDYGAEEVEYGSNGNKTTKAVQLSNIDKALANASGANSTTLISNYTVKNPTQTYTIADGAGRIDPLEITKADITAGFVGTITKEYDNTDDVLNPEKYYKIQVSKTVNGQTIQTDLGYKLSSAKYDNQQKDVTTGHGVTYTFDGLTSNALKNFVVGDAVQADYATGTTKTTTGNITPRKIYAQFDPDVTRALTTKEYNGDNTLTGADKTQDDLDKYVKTTNLLSQTDKQHDDGAKVKIVTTYDDENVAYGTDSNVTTKALNYKLSIDGADAKNYAFYDGTTALSATPTALTNDTLTDATGGKITQKALTVTDATLADKTYDGGNAVKNISGITFTLDGLVDKDKSFALSTTSVGAKVAGTYDDAHVNRKDTAKSDTKVAGQDSTGADYYYKGVTYTGLDDALAYMRTDEGNKIAGNYSIDKTVYFEEAKSKGVIRPLAITANAVHEDWSKITKVYDGKTTIDDPTSKLTYSVLVGSDGTVRDKSVTKTEGDGNTVITIPYTLTSAEYYDKANGTAQKDAGKNLTAKYVIDSFTSTALRDFDMGTTSGVHDAIVGTHWKTGDSTTDVSITPKLIDVALQKTKLADKVYDATTAVKDTNGIIIDNGKDDGNVAGEADADKVTVTLGKDYVYDKKDVGTRTVTYTVTLGNNTKGNYTLKKDATTDAERDTKTLDATGEITARPVYVDFKGGVVPTNIDKEYGETTLTTVDATNVNDAKREVLHPENYRPLVVAADKADNSGIVDSDVSLDTDNIKLLYANNGNVARKADGSVTTQTVLFDNVNLKDSTSDASGNAKNYEIVYSNTNHTATDYDNKTVLAGQGTITPKTIALSYDNATGLAKTYDGTSDISGATYVAGGKTLQQTLEAQEASLLLPTDTLNLTVTGDYTGTAETEANGGTKNGAANIHSNKTERVDDGKLGVDASVAWTNGNYDVTFKATDTSKELDVDTDRPIEKNTATGATEPNQFTFTKGVKTTQGTINPKKLTVTGNDSATKVYDGNEFAKEVAFTANSMPGVTFDGVVDHDKQVNSLIATGDATYYNEAGTVSDANAGVAEDSDALAKHQVQWKLKLKNQDYTLDTDTAKGAGTITRAPLTVTSNSVSTRYGQTPTFTGTVTGWKTAADEAAYNAAVAANPSLITWNTAPGAPSRGSSSIYGWYRYDNAATAGQGWSFDPAHASSGTDFYARKGADAYRNFGNYGRNYQFVQVPGTYTSQADAPKMDDVNPAKHFRPDMEAYNYASHDEAGTAIRDPKAGIEYKAGGTSLRTDDSSSYTGTMKVEGAGDIVNLTQSGTQASADRVDLTGEGANYTLSGAEDVPTADVTVADVTELADELANVTDTTATAATTTTTTVTDDDDDVLKEATETTTREADAAVENTETATAATELFSDTITGTNIAS